MTQTESTCWTSLQQNPKTARDSACRERCRCCLRLASLPTSSGAQWWCHYRATERGGRMSPCWHVLAWNLLIFFVFADVCTFSDTPSLNASCIRTSHRKYAAGWKRWLKNKKEQCKSSCVLFLFLLRVFDSVQVDVSHLSCSRCLASQVGWSRCQVTIMSDRKSLHHWMCLWSSLQL